MQVKKELSQTTWKKQMDSHYYKSLDIKSNFIKILERKKLINKNLIKELKRQALLNKNFPNGIILVDTINDLHQKDNIFKILKTTKHLYNPVIGFKIGDKKVIEDCVDVLGQYILFSKQGNTSEIMIYFELMKKMIVNFFKIDMDVGQVKIRKPSFERISQIE